MVLHLRSIEPPISVQYFRQIRRSQISGRQLGECAAQLIARSMRSLSSRRRITRYQARAILDRVAKSLVTGPSSRSVRISLVERLVEPPPENVVKLPRTAQA
jgi:hypothetical protein